MSDKPKRSIWFYLCGCSPLTLLVLLGILLGLVLGPALVNMVMYRINPPDPRVYPLPEEHDGRPWLWDDGSWFFTVDRDDDGSVDCYSRAGTGTELYAVDGRAAGCAHGLMRMFSRMGGVRTMDSALRAALQRTVAFKTERGWLRVSVTDVDGDDTADCVLDRFGAVIAHREGVVCPGDAVSIPVSLVDHERFEELDALFRLESLVRRMRADMDEASAP